MKTYDETAREVLARRDGYIKEKKRARKKLFSVSLPVIAAALLIGGGIYGIGRYHDASPEPGRSETVNAVTETGKDKTAGGDTLTYPPTPVEHTEDSNGDTVGRLVIDGKEYLQVTAAGVSGVDDPKAYFMLGEYLGKAEDYEGAYKKMYEEDGITGDVYRINWEDADIIVLLSNGGFVTLKETK